MPKITTLFGTQTREIEVKENSTINMFVDELKPSFPIIVWQNDNPVLRKDWNKTLSANDSLVIQALPLKGEDRNKIPRMILQTVGTLISTIGVVLAPAGIGFALIALGMGITLLAGVLFPPDMPQDKARSNETSSPTYSLNASSNQARLYQPIPEGFGKRRITPDLIAYPYTVYAGNSDQYLYQFFACGRGEYLIHSMAYGDITIWRNNGTENNTTGNVVTSAYGDKDTIEVEVVEPGNKVTSMFDNVETSVSVGGQELESPNKIDNSGNQIGEVWIGPFPSNPPGTEFDQVQLDITLPSGVGIYNDDGNLVTYSVGWEFQYRPIDDGGVPTTATWRTFWMETLSLSTLNAQRISRFFAKWYFEGAKRIEIRGKKTTNRNDKASDTLLWESLKAYLPGTLIYDQTVVAVKVKATNNMTKAASEKFTVLQTRKLPIWDQATNKWSAPTPTRRFAPAIAQMCLSKDGGNLTQNQVDLISLEEIDKKLQARKWNFDAWIDDAYSVMQLLISCCTSYRVLPHISGGILSFVMEEEGRPIRHVFTPHDMVRNSLKLSWNTWSAQSPDDVIVGYQDEDYNYAGLEVQATLPGSPSTQPKTISNPTGIVTRELAFRYAAYLSACNRYRRVNIEFQTELLGRLINIGDVISVSHPRYKNGVSGRVTDWNETALLIQLDAEYATPQSSALYLTLTDSRGSVWGPTLLRTFESGYAVFQQTDYNLVALQQGNPFTWITAGDDSNPTIWTLQTARYVADRFLVQRVSFASDNKVTINAVSDDPRVYGVIDSLEVPKWQYRITAPDLTVPSPEGIRLKYYPKEHLLTIIWEPVSKAYSYIIEHSFGTGTLFWVQDAQIYYGTQVDVYEIPPGLINVRVKAVGVSQSSFWATTSEVLEEGSLIPPPEEGGTP